MSPVHRVYRLIGTIGPQQIAGQLTPGRQEFRRRTDVGLVKIAERANYIT